jgi:hypothetical protein
MHEQYFKYPSITFRGGFFKSLFLKIFGKKIEEFHGPYHCVWYLYGGVLYMTKYSGL